MINFFYHLDVIFLVMHNYAIGTGRPGLLE